MNLMGNRSIKLTLLQIAVLITIIGFVIRLVGLGEYSFWFDEALEVLRARRPWPEILDPGQGADPPLFRLLLAPIASSSSEFWLRLPSVVFSSLAVFLAYYWVALLGYPILGLFLAALLALAPSQIYYAQEVSQYSLSVCLAVLLLIVHERAAQSGRWLDWLVLATVILISLYTYYGLALMLPILGLDLLYRTLKKRNNQQLLGLAAAYLLAGLGIAALYFLMLDKQIQRFSDRNLTPIFADGGLGEALRNLDDQLIDGFLNFQTMAWSPDPPLILSLLFAAMFLGGAYVLISKTTIGWRVIITLVSILTAMYVAFGLGYYPFGSRYALLIAPLLFLPIAALLWWISQWKSYGIGLPLLVAAIFIVFWPNTLFLPNPWRDYPREDLRPVIEYVDRHSSADELIYVYYGAAPAYQVYVNNPAENVEIGRWFRAWSTEEKIQEIKSKVGDSRGLWLLMSHVYPGEDSDLVQGLSDSFELVEKVQETGASALHFVLD